MILAIDIGNTNIVFGVYNGEALAFCLRLRSNALITADEYAASVLFLFEQKGIKKQDIAGVVIGSVVPHLQVTISHFVKKYLGIEPLCVGVGVKSGIRVRVENQKEVGADRIANACGAIRKFGFPAIVIDFGTATTFDVVNSKGEYAGGVICPGVVSALDSLHVKTAQLPETEIKKPASVVGKNTVSSMQSGIFYGYIGLINGLLERIINEEFSTQNPFLISTGGLAGMFTDELKYDVIYEPALTLDGLKAIYEENLK